LKEKQRFLDLTSKVGLVIGTTFSWSVSSDDAPALD